MIKNATVGFPRDGKDIGIDDAWSEGRSNIWFQQRYKYMKSLTKDGDVDNRAIVARHYHRLNEDIALPAWPLLLRFKSVRQ